MGNIYEATKQDNALMADIHRHTNTKDVTAAGLVLNEEPESHQFDAVAFFFMRKAQITPFQC